MYTDRELVSAKRGKSKMKGRKKRDRKKKGGKKMGTKKKSLAKHGRRLADGPNPAAIAGVVDDRLHFGLLLTDADGAVIEANETARQIVSTTHSSWPDNPTCCALFGCNRNQPLAGHCIAKLAAESEDPLPEMRIDMPPERPTSAIWVTAARAAPNSSQVLMHLRPAMLGDRRRRTELHWMEEAQLRIYALGETTVETEETTIMGDWLLQRPGQLLKYLVCQRRRPAPVDEIVEALWPESGPNGRSTVRYFVHILRERLEPSRAPRSTSPFIISVAGAYSLDRRVALDVDEFETLVSAGQEGAAETPEEHLQDISRLERAVEIYRGDLFAEEPFAEWVFEERGRMKSLAQRALRRLVEHHRTEGDLAAAARYMEREADLQPFDTEVQRALVRLLLEQGRRSEAKRRYAFFRQRLLDEFGEEPDFRLSDFATGRGRDGGGD